MPDDNAEVEKRIRDSVSIELVKAQYNEILNLLREIREDIKDHETRLRSLENRVSSKAESEEVDRLSESVVQLRERLSLWQVGQGVFTVVSSAIATVASTLLGGHKIP